jgi:hypothetical protein
MLLRKNGYLGYISSNKWMKVQYGLGMRKLLKQKHIVKLIDFFELKVFEDASIEPIIVIIKNVNEPNKSIEVARIDTLQYDDFNSYLKTRIQVTNQTELDDDGWNLMQDESKDILGKIKRGSILVGEFVNKKIYRGITTGANHVYVIDKQKYEQLVKKDKKAEQIIRPLIDGVDMDNYTFEIGKKWLILSKIGTNIDNYPSIKEHLTLYKKDLDEVWEVKRKKQKWFELRGCKYYDDFDKDKIVYIHTAKDHKFALDTSKENYVINNCYFISSSNRYLLAYLNSNLFKYYKMNTFVAFGDASTKGRCKLDYNKMVKVPIKPISKEQEKEFDSAVNEMIKLKAGKQTQKIEEMDKKLNDMIYKVYGITAEERKIIEGV